MLGASQEEVQAHQDMEDAYAKELVALYERAAADGLNIDTVQAKGLLKYYKRINGLEAA